MVVGAAAAPAAVAAAAVAVVVVVVSHICLRAIVLPEERKCWGTKDLARKKCQLKQLKF